MKARQLEAELRELLSGTGPDEELRARLEVLARHRAFPGLTWLWGPALYRRNRVLFRPLILACFSPYRETLLSAHKPVPFKAELEAWLGEVDRHDDLELFRRLWYWQVMHRARWDHRRANEFFRQELLAALKDRQGARRRLELRKREGFYELDEATALAVFRADAAAAEPFILRHLPWAFLQPPTLWEKLFHEALSAGRSDFAWRLYRHLTPVSRWEKDVLALARDRSLPPGELARGLEQRHPQQTWGQDPGRVLIELLELRGRDVVPYVMRHLVQVYRPWFGRGSYGKLLELARKHDWVDLWSAILRTSAPNPEFNQAVRALAEVGARPEQDALRRLLALAGVSREFNFGPLGLAMVHPLEDETALALYDRFPALVRGPYRMHLSVPPWGGKGYPRLVERALGVEDDQLVDFLASRYLAVHKPGPEVERLADHFQSLKDEPGGFARRAASVLTRVPAYTLHRYRDLIRKNRLTRLLFERSVRSFLEDPSGVADLVEGSEIHVQALGYRVLAQDDDRARAMAADHLTLLLGTLLRPLQRVTRALAFGALANAAAASPEVAARILARAREVAALPDRRYPKEKLLGLIGRILHRWPELRGEREHPVVYRAS